MTTSQPVEPLLPVSLGPGKLPYARGVRAGRWIFASGVMAADFEHGLAPDLLDRSRELTDGPRAYREARHMYARAEEVLQAGGANFSHVVRTDQYYPDWRAVPFLHQARREYCGSYIAPSTSILEPKLLLPGAGMSMDLIAVDPRRSPPPEAIVPDGLDLPSTSAFVPVAIAGDFVFVAGFLAAWKPGDLGGIAPEAQPPAGHLWKGNRIQLEVDYIIRKKLIPALAGAGSSLQNVIKAQVYLADIADVAAFKQVWSRYFGERAPALTCVPTLNPGFAIADARCEINLVALRDAGSTRAEPLSIAGRPAVGSGAPVALRAGDLLLFSGLIAADEDGLAPGVRVDEHQPYFSSSIEAQMHHLLDVAERACEAAGTSLRNIVRIHQFHTDLAEFYPACRVWQQRLPGQPFPFSAVQVPSPLLVPGCTVQLDLWVYAP